MPNALTFLLILCVTLSGCATVVSYPQQPSELRTCQALLEDYDTVVKRNGAYDAQDYPLPSFPYLRSDRFLAAYDLKSLSAPAFSQWLRILRNKADVAWQLQWQRLPSELRNELKAKYQTSLQQDLPHGLETCGNRLLAFDQRRPDFSGRLAREVRRPDEYIGWWRVVGLYPLAAWIASSRYDALRQELQQEFERGLSDMPAMSRIFYAPPVSTLDEHGVYEILTRSRNNPLGIPAPNADELDHLFIHFAPRLQIGQQSGDDAIGTVSIIGGRPEVDTSRPVVYTLASYTKYHAEVLLQLNYIVWFPARTPQKKGDLYAGHLDGITWRVTLDRDGRPMLFDTMHNCGCYHAWIVSPSMALRDDLEQAEEPIVFHVDEIADSPTVKLGPASHYLRGVGEAVKGNQELGYILQSYDTLRAMPDGDGTASLFDTKGLIPSSRRGESLILWPLGVPLPGGMRQWGHHAIVFVGRQHFDDPTLIEDTF